MSAQGAAPPPVGTNMAPQSPRALPPTPQEIQRKLGSPQLPSSSTSSQPPLLSLSLPSPPPTSTTIASDGQSSYLTAAALGTHLSSGAGKAPERRGSNTSSHRGRPGHFSSSGMSSGVSSASDDESSAYGHSQTERSTYSAASPSLATSSLGAFGSSGFGAQQQQQQQQQQGPGGLPLSAISEASSGSDSDTSLSRHQLSSVPQQQQQPLHPSQYSAFVNASAARPSHTARSSTSTSTGGPGGTSSSNELKSGYLMKKGERRKAWKKRWFVLRGDQIALYKNDKEYKLLRHIPLGEIHTCAPIELKRHLHTFGLVTPKRTYYIQASSQNEANSWCRAVEEAKQAALRGHHHHHHAGVEHSAASSLSGDLTPGAVERNPPVVEQQSARYPSPPRQSTTAAIPIASTPSYAAIPQPSVGSAYPSTSFATSMSSATSPPTTLFSHPTASSISPGGTSVSTHPPSTLVGAGGFPGPPPNSLVSTAGGFGTSAGGALQLQGLDGNGLELSGVDEGLERLRLRDRHGSVGTADGGIPLVGESGWLNVPRSESLNRGATAPSPGGASAGGGEYFSSPSSAGGGYLDHPPSSPGPGGLHRFASISGAMSSSEDEDDPELLPPPQPTAVPSTTTTTPATKSASGFGDPNKVILSGYLMKQGKRKNWRKRWFVLMSGRLVYSRSHMDSRIHRQIPLSRILDAIEHTPTARRPSNNVPQSPGLPSHNQAISPSSSVGGFSVGGGGGMSQEHTFKVITPKRTYLLCAPSEEDEIAWLAALQCLVARKGQTAAAAASAPPLPPPVAASPSNATAPPPTPTRRESSNLTSAGMPSHGRQRSVTDAARAAVREGVSSFRERAGVTNAH